MARLKDPWMWLHGLVSAFIGGAVTVIADVSADALMDGSVTLNFSRLGLKAVIAGGILAALYLKQKPLPEIEP